MTNPLEQIRALTDLITRQADLLKNMQQYLIVQRRMLQTLLDSNDSVQRRYNEHVKQLIERTAWERPALFDWLQERGGIAEREMLRTFNCGIGMVVAVRPDDETAASAVLKARGERVYAIGSIAPGDGRVRID